MGAPETCQRCGKSEDWSADGEEYFSCLCDECFDEEEYLRDKVKKLEKALEEMAQHTEQFTQAGVSKGGVPTTIAFTNNLKRILKRALEQEK